MERKYKIKFDYVSDFFYAKKKTMKTKNIFKNKFKLSLFIYLFIIRSVLNNEII